MKTVAKERQQEQEQQHRHSISRPYSFSSKSDSSSYDALFDRKVDLVTAGLTARHRMRIRYEICHENAVAVCDYIISMKTEINLSDNYRKIIIEVLAKLSRFHNQKPLKDITRDDILLFLDNLRKSEGSDPLHKWIGTYNIYRIQFMIETMIMTTTTEMERIMTEMMTMMTTTKKDTTVETAVKRTQNKD